MATEVEDSKESTAKPITSGLAFSGICNVRNTEAHLRWLGAQVSFFLNLPAFAGAVFRLVTKLEVPELAAIAIGGFLLVGANEFLRQFIKRDNKLMDLWNDKLDELERVNGIEGSVQVFFSRRYRRLRTSRTRLQRRLEDAMFVCIVGSGAIALWAVTKLVRTLFFT